MKIQEFFSKTFSIFVKLTNKLFVKNSANSLMPAVTLQDFWGYILIVANDINFNSIQ
jgi:hypothetical protein